MNSPQSKKSIFKKIGYTALISGVIWVCYYILKSVLLNPNASIVSVLYKGLIAFIFNPFVWIGLILLWQDDKKANRSPSRWMKFLKLLGVCAAILTPIVITQLVMQQLGRNVRAPVINTAYKLPEEFTKEDVVRIIDKMREDFYYNFYFNSLTNDETISSINFVYSILDQHRSKMPLYERIMEQQQKIMSLATVFNYLVVPDKYYVVPKNYPELTSSVRTFLIEEFKLTILGTIFKSTYAENFSFDWDIDSVKAARKIKEIIRRTTKRPTQKRKDTFKAGGEIKEGIQKDYYESGQVRYEVSYKNGKMNGKSILYYENGQVKAEGRFKDAIPVGLIREYYDGGELKVEGSYSQGKLHGPYKIYYQTGELKEERTYFDGEIDGQIIKYDKNGDLLTE